MILIRIFLIVFVTLVDNVINNLLAFFQVWSLQNCKLKTDHIGHHGYLNTVTMSPDGSLCASGGKAAKAMLWDLNDGKHLYTLDNNDIINSLCFRYVIDKAISSGFFYMTWAEERYKCIPDPEFLAWVLGFFLSVFIQW